MNIFALCSLATFLISIYLGSLVYNINKKNKLNRMFGLLAIMEAYWAFTEFQSRITDSFELARFWVKVEFLWPFAIAVLMHFILVFSEQSRLLRRKMTYILLYVPTLFFSYIELTTNLITGDPVKTYWGWTYQNPEGSVIYYLNLIWALLSIVFSVYILLSYYFKNTECRKKLQAKYVLIGLIIPIVVGTITEMLPPILNMKIPALTATSLILGNAFIGYAIWKYELFSLTSEKTVRGILDTMSDSLILFSPDKKILTINQAAEKLLGYKNKELIGQHISVLFKGREEDTNLHEKIFEMLTNQRFISDIECTFISRYGIKIPISLSASLMNYKDGSLNGTIYVARDITNRKHTEEALVKAKESAEAANKAKSEFLANMSHEIRTPMNGIIGMTELLSSTEIYKEQKEYVNTISSSAEALLILLNDILDFSKIEANKLSLEKNPFNIRNIIEDNVRLFSIKTNEKGIGLFTEYSQNISDRFIGDSVRIRQIITNLIGNAVKFTNEGYVKIKVESIGTCEDRETLRIRVEDTGIGIPEGKLQNIFDKFTQADMSITRKYGGTGLGLAITKQLVELMNGYIYLESKVGIGSTFWFEITLPIDNISLYSQNEVSSNDLNNYGKEKSHNAYYKGLKVLLVEDNKVNQMVAKKILAKLGLNTDIASDGKEAIDIIKNKEYDIIFMDCQMPVMDGFETTKAIRIMETNSDNHIPIIAMTANALKEDREECIAAGLDDHIAKPIRTEKILDVLKRFDR